MRFLTKTEWKIFLIFWIIFSVFAASDRWNDNASLDLTRAIVDEHRFEIDSYANNTGDRAYYNGHYYSDKVPGTALLAVPLYQAYKIVFGKIPYHNSLDEDNPSWKYQLFLFFAISLISAVCAALTIVLVYRISKYFTSNNLHRNLVIIVLGLGTLLPHAGRQFNSHAISTFFIFLCFYLIFKMKKEKVDHSFIAGLVGGFAVLSEYRVLFVLIGLFIIVLTFKKWICVLRFMAGISIFLGILLLYHYTIYGSPFENSIGHPDVSIWEDKTKALICGDKVFFNKHYNDSTVPKLIAAIKGNLIYSEKLWANINRTIRLLIDPFKGLFFYSPILLLSFLGLFLMYKEYKLETLVISFCFFIILLFLAGFVTWWMGLSFGPRYLTPLIPFLMIPLFYLFKKTDIRIILFFVTISILISLIGLQSVNLSHDPIIFSNTYCEKLKSFTPLANPLFDNYLPSILKYSDYDPKHSENFLILERLLGFRIVPLANIALLLITFLLIWKNRIIFKN
ncbi:MAG: glycosyltransferase family 39 protein [Nanoarchaeota archaeon]|nr:glycosyltransferase family 39 protein [Nanoarchaeota archaeon]